VQKRVFTEVEKKWKAALEGDQTYKLLTLEEAFEDTPPLGATELHRKQFGDFQMAWCKFYQLHVALEMMKDTVCLVHSPLNCVACSRNFHNMLGGNYGCQMAHSPSTAMDRRQVIFGGEDDLYEAIKAVDRDYRPKLMVVMTGCAPGLTQDDVSRVVERAQSEVGAKLHFISSSGYEAVTFGEMMDQGMKDLSGLIDPPSRVDKEAVNILGHFREKYWAHSGCQGTRRYPSDADELARYIEGLGLKIHRVILGGDYEYLRTAAEAGVNTIHCGTWGIPMAEVMKERFGTPYSPMQLPLGVGPASIL